MEDDTNIDTSTDVELRQEVLDESGQLSDDSVVAVTTTIIENTTLGTLRDQVTDFDNRLASLESFYQNQKTFLETEKQKVSDQIAQIQ